MEIKERINQDVAILRLEGRLDLNTAKELKKHVKGLLGRNAKNIALSFAGITFINSSGLASLISIHKDLRLAKGKLAISDVNVYVKEIFEITQLDSIFDIYTTESEAVASFSLAPGKFVP